MRLSGWALLISACFVWPAFAAALGAAVGSWQRDRDFRRHLRSLSGRSLAELQKIGPYRG